MQCIVLQEPGVLIRQECAENIPLPAATALVKVHRVGICGTDYHAFRGRQPFFSYPRVLGHELGVEVMEVAANAAGIKAGDRCAVEPYLNCGNCQPCRAGKTNCCSNLRVLGVHTDGGLQEYMQVPVNKLHPSARLSFEQLALVETLGIGAHAVARAQVQAADTVLVIGAGPIGLAVMQFAQLAGAKMVVTDLVPNRLAFCQQHFGVKSTLLPTGALLTADLREILQGDLPTVVFDATGNAASMMQAFGYAAPGGKLVLVGLFPGDLTFNDPEFHRRELTLLASRNATATDLKQIVRQLEAGELNTAAWVSHRCAFVDLPETFERWLRPESQVIKAMVTFPASA